MKKTLLSLAILGVAFAANAENRNASMNGVEINSNKIETSVTLSTVSPKILSSFTPATRATNADLAGKWTFGLGDYYFEESVNAVITVDFQATPDDDGVLFFEDPTNYYLPFMGVYQDATSEVMFPAAVLGQTNDGTYVIQVPFHYVETADGGALEPLEDGLFGDYNATEGAILFDVDYGLAWVACTQPDLSTQTGFFDILDFVWASRSGKDPAGIESIIDLNAPVEYFNLQGMKVANPEKGTVTIMKQGKVTKKVIF